MSNAPLLRLSLTVLTAALFISPNLSLSVNSAHRSGEPRSRTTNELAYLNWLRGSGDFDFLKPTPSSFFQRKAVSSDWLWRDKEKSENVSANGTPQTPYRTLTLNGDALTQILKKAPMEFTDAVKRGAVVVTLPMPDGSFARFRIEESPSMDPALAARFREIKSYRGRGIDDPVASVRFDWSPFGFHALILSNGSAVNILPPNRNDITTYASYYDQGAAFECLVTESQQRQLGKASGTGINLAVGSTLCTYRIAVAATNEYCADLGGNTVAGTVASINSFLNGINVIYERELSVHLNLVNNTSIIYSGDNNVCGGSACTSANDPYTNGDTGAMLNEVRPDLLAKVGQANYDVGHVLGTNSGGQAFIGVVCNDNSGIKGGGATGMFAPAGNSSAVGLWAHELGHQFGGNHTQNGTSGSCNNFLGSPQRHGSTAYETGSGITIMSYAGSCGSDNIANTRDLRFHAGTFAEINAFLATATCNMGNWIATGNQVPTINAGPARIIPRNTPFTLTATGSDPDASDVPNLTYIWEQIDAGGTDFFNPPYTDAGDSSATTRPIFRVFSPVNSPSRTFPSLTYILNNANTPPAIVGGFQTAENLPQIGRALNFRSTIRDNRGGVNDSSVALTVDGNSGPFLVTAPNGGEVWSGARTVNWSVNNTNNAPVSAASVKISLSTDGGNTFPITLVATTPNNGSAIVTLPNGIVSSTARIKIEGIGNIFFDISDANFTITPADSCPAITKIVSTAGRVGDTVTISGVNFTSGGNVNAVKFSNSVAAAFTVNSDTTITTTVPNGAVGGSITISKPGCVDRQTPAYTICPNPPITISIDSGTAGTAWSSGSNAYYVNRLTPTSYPAILNQVSIYFATFSNLPAGTPITVVAGANTAGTADINNTSFQTVTATVGTLGQFSAYTLPNAIQIASGDFVIGFTTAGGSGIFPAATSNNATTGRSYGSGDGTFFFVYPFNNDGLGNFMIRGQAFTGICSTPTALRVDTVTPAAGRTSGVQQIHLTGALAGLSTVSLGGTNAAWFYTNGAGDTSSITVTTPAHAVGAVQIDLTPTSGSPYSKANAFAYLPTVFTDDTIMVGVTTSKAQHILELRQAVDAMRAVAGLSGAPWTDPALAPGDTIKAIHILDLRTYLDDAATRLGYSTSPYTDPGLTSDFVIKRIHIEELRQRIRTIAG